MSGTNRVDIGIVRGAWSFVKQHFMVRLVGIEITRSQTEPNSFGLEAGFLPALNFGEGSAASLPDVRFSS
jgi:hypothetical protein